MRDIKYRAKRIDNGEWVYGLLWKKKFGSEKLFMSYFPDEDDQEDVVVIEPETVGQYTEIKDKDKNEIYDGAIAEVSNIERFEIIDQKTDKILRGKCNALVGISEGHTYIWLKVPYSRGLLNIGAKHLVNGLVKYESEGRLMTSSVKVIGNIHDNPELIGH